MTRAEPYLESAAVTDADGRHIVDVLIAERAPRLMAHPLWPLVRPFLFTLLGHRRAVKMADAIAAMSGAAAMDYLSELLSMRVGVIGLENIPAKGATMIACNHPTGIADGVAIWDGLRPRRPDLIYFANGDALRVNPRLGEIVVPVEWAEARKSRDKTRETLRLTAAAFAEERALVVFPSGRLAYWNEDRLTERPWLPTVVTLARKHDVPLVPVHIQARNSGLFYLFSRLSTELRDVTLFRELLNKRRTSWRITVGPPVAHEALIGDPAAIAARLQHHVEFVLAKDPGAIFPAGS